MRIRTRLSLWYLSVTFTVGLIFTLGTYTAMRYLLFQTLERERELIIARTGDGRARAKARGVRFGRPPSLTTHQRKEALQRLQEGVLQADLARTYGVSQATISRLASPTPFDGAGASVAAAG